MNIRSSIYRALRQSQKYTRTDMVYLARGSFWLTLGQGVTTLFAFGLAVFFANWLPKEVYGNYRYVISVAGILASFSLTGMGTAITRGVAKGAHGLLKAGFMTQLKWSIGTFVASWVLSAYYFMHDNTALSVSFLIVGVFVPLTSSALLYGPFWEGKKDFKRNSIYNIYSIIVYSTALFITAYLTRSLTALIFVYFGVQAISAVFFYIKTLASDNGTEDPHHHETLGYAKHLSLLSVFSTIAGQIDKVLIFQFIGAGPLAVYAIAQIPPAQIQMLLKQVSRLAFPKISERPIEHIRASIYKKMFIFTIYISIPVLLYIALAPLIFHTFFPKYPDAILYSQVLAVPLLLFSKKLLAMTFLAHASTKQLYLTSLSSSISRIILTLVLLPLYGIWGVIAVTVIINVFGMISSLWMLQRIK